MATFNRTILDDVLRSRSLTAEALRARTGISLSDFEAEISREKGPSKSLIDAIAKELSVPAFIFFMEKTPPLENNIVDFRHPQPAITSKRRQTIESIQVAHSIQREAQRLGSLTARTRLPGISADFDSLVATCERMRNFFEISIEEQINARDTRVFYYLCRKKIEAKDIFVLQDSFPDEDGAGYALWHETCPLIIINSLRQNPGRRLFTLIHELAHILLKRTGISDPFKHPNVIERYCNAFAAEFLVPTSKINSLLHGLSVPRRPSTDDIKRISKRLKFSQEATVIRLEELGRIAPGSVEEWRKAISNFGNPDFKSEGGGRGHPGEEKIKLAKYGFLFAKSFENAIKARKLSEIELYRISGIKPKWLSSFFEYARTGDLQSIEDE